VITLRERAKFYADGDDPHPSKKSN